MSVKLAIVCFELALRHTKRIPTQFKIDREVEVRARQTVTIRQIRVLRFRLIEGSNLQS